MPGSKYFCDLLFIHYSLGNDGTLFYIQTNKDAAREKIVTVDISVEPYEFKELIPEDPEALLGQTALVHDHILLVYSRNVCQTRLWSTSSHMKLGERWVVCLFKDGTETSTSWRGLCGVDRNFRKAIPILVFCNDYRLCLAGHCTSLRLYCTWGAEMVGI